MATPAEDSGRTPSLRYTGKEFVPSAMRAQQASAVPAPAVVPPAEFKAPEEGLEAAGDRDTPFMIPPPPPNKPGGLSVDSWSLWNDTFDHLQDDVLCPPPSSCPAWLTQKDFQRWRDEWQALEVAQAIEDTLFEQEAEMGGPDNGYGGDMVSSPLTSETRMVSDVTASSALFRGVQGMPGDGYGGNHHYGGRSQRGHGRGHYQHQGPPRGGGHWGYGGHR
jgi:hypothetical protein